MQGFTLIELLLTTALVGIISVFSLPIFTSFQNQNSLRVGTDVVSSQLRRAQGLSRVMFHDSSWGVHISNTSSVLFAGDTYDSRDIDLDEVHDFSDAITVSGISDVKYEKLSGRTTTSGTILFSLYGDEMQHISINTQGTVSVQAP